MARFSASLGYLWHDLPLPDAIARAAEAGFDAVECHWPYDTPPGQVRRALDAAGIPMVGLNATRGDVTKGEFGLAALPGRDRDARAAIAQALDYGAELGSPHVHVMAGIAHGAQARAAFTANLAWGAERAAANGLALVIEPINQRDAPGYVLETPAMAAAIIAEVGAPNLRLMFDCYHVAIIAGDCLGELERHFPLIGHIQIAGVPSRREPDDGEIDFRRVIARIDRLGYTGYIGAEYRPRTTPEAGLGWLAAFRQPVPETAHEP